MIATQDRPDCPLCKRHGVPLYEARRDRLFDASGEWSHLRCPDCGLVWLHPQPRSDAIAELYASYFTHEDRGADTPFKRAVKRGIPAARYGYADRVPDAAERRRGWWLAHLGPLREVAEQSTMALPASRRGRLLDVGCGAGELLRHLESLGWEVAGAEPDPEAREVARAALRGPIFEDVVEADLPGDHFDVVTLSHVIEHLIDPLETLHACHRVLRPGGWLAIATPNAGSLGHRHFGADWLHLDAPRHLTLYDPSTLREVVTRAGFEIVRCSTPCATAHFVWLASSLLRRRGRLPGVDVSGASLFDQLGGFVFWAVEYLRAQRGEGCGEEVLLIASKPERAAP